MSSIKPRTTRLRAAAVAAGLMIGGIAAVSSPPGPAAAAHSHAPQKDSAPTVGARAIGFELKTLDGKPLGLESFRGKPLVINFFASWCDPCREEMPLINELAARGSQEGYGVIGVAVEDTRAAVTQYAREAQLVFPIALDLNSKVRRATASSGRRRPSSSIRRA